MKDNEDIVEALKEIREELFETTRRLSWIFWALIMLVGLLFLFTSFLDSGMTVISIKQHEKEHITQLQKQEAK